MNVGCVIRILMGAPICLAAGALLLWAVNQVFGNWLKIISVSYSTTELLLAGIFIGILGVLAIVDELADPFRYLGSIDPDEIMELEDDLQPVIERSRKRREQS